MFVYTDKNCLFLVPREIGNQLGVPLLASRVVSFSLKIGSDESFFYCCSAAN
jgi:hypothetical protein